MLSSYLCSICALNMRQNQQQNFPFFNTSLPASVSPYPGHKPDLFSWRLKDSPFQSPLHKPPLCSLCYFLLCFCLGTCVSLYRQVSCSHKIIYANLADRKKEQEREWTPTHHQSLKKGYFLISPSQFFFPLP